LSLVTRQVGVAPRLEPGYFLTMSFAEIEQEAKSLPSRKRAALVAALLDTLPAPGADISDEVVARRDRELEEGQVEAIPHNEFVRRVARERRR
jgi:hypothetical protein